MAKKVAPEGLLTIESKLNGISCKMVVESIVIRRGKHYTLYGYLYFRQSTEEDHGEAEWLNIGATRKEATEAQMKKYGLELKE